MVFKKNSGFTVLEMALLIVVVGAFSCMAWYILKMHASTGGEQTHTATLQPKRVQASSLKSGTYKHISFSYPANWNYNVPTQQYPNAGSYLVTHVGQTGAGDQETSLIINFTTSPYPASATNLESYVQYLSTQGQGFGLENKQALTINGTQALRYDSGCCASVSDSVFFVVNGNLYEVSAVVGGPVDPSVLQSFKPTFTTFLSRIRF